MKPATTLRFATLAFVVCGAALALSGTVGRTLTPDDNRKKLIDPKSLPQPGSTPSQGSGPRMVPQPDGVNLTVPKGFKVNVFAEGLNNARWIAVAPNGDVFVTEAGPNRVTVLRDTKGEGKADIKQVYAEGLNLPFGIAFQPGFLYITNTNSIVPFPYKDGDLQAGGGPEKLADLPGLGYRQHWTRDLVFSADGKKMYVSVGSEKDIDEPEEPHRAAILEFNADGTGERVYASGIRNASGKAINPVTKQLWADCNERDGLGDELVPDYVTAVNDGGHYGWPTYYIGPNRDPRVKDTSLAADKVIVPDCLLQPHSSTLGLLFYSGSQFPKEYRNDAFVALHGSGNRLKRTGYKLIRIHFKNGKPAGTYEDFLSGWMLGEDDPRVWGRPAGLAVAKDGSLLVVDDGANKIWRVSYGK
jgi:glucose/arabinose dehydrogenase